MRCEDYPCCGHVGDDGPCPDFDPETGRQLDMKCVCGASVPLHSRTSLCRACLHDPECMGCSECDEPYDDEEEGDLAEGDEDGELYHARRPMFAHPDYPDE